MADVEMQNKRCLLTNDFEYVNYFCEKHQIEYPQIVTTSANVKRIIDDSFVESVPIFLVVNATGNIMQKHVGLDSIDEFIESIYKHYFFYNQ